MTRNPEPAAGLGGPGLRVLGGEAVKLRDALTQLELAYVRITGSEGGPPAGEKPQPEPEGPGQQGPAQSSGKLWVPGQ